MGRAYLIHEVPCGHERVSCSVMKARFLGGSRAFRAELQSSPSADVSLQPIPAHSPYSGSSGRCPQLCTPSSSPCVCVCVCCCMFPGTCKCEQLAAVRARAACSKSSVWALARRAAVHMELQQLSEGLLMDGSRLGCSTHMLQNACLFQSLPLEPCLVKRRILHLVELVQACLGFLSCLCCCLADFSCNSFSFMS